MSEREFCWVGICNKVVYGCGWVGDCLFWKVIVMVGGLGWKKGFVRMLFDL